LIEMRESGRGSRSEIRERCEMNIYSLAEGKGLELAQARLEIVAFLREEPELWRTPQGALKVSERRQRLELAEKYVTDPVRDYLTEKGADLEILVDQDPGLSRLEFCEMLTGENWIPEETR